VISSKRAVPPNVRKYMREQSTASRQHNAKGTWNMLLAYAAPLYQHMHAQLSNQHDMHQHSKTISSAHRRPILLIVGPVSRYGTQQSPPSVDLPPTTALGCRCLWRSVPRRCCPVHFEGLEQGRHRDAGLVPAIIASWLYAKEESRRHSKAHLLEPGCDERHGDGG
jgi:hypothetical protein